MGDKSELIQEMTFSVDLFGDGLNDSTRTAANEITLFPANGASAELTVTLRYSDGRPAPGQSVSCSSRPQTLAGAEWRNVNSLAPRFGRGANTLRERVQQGLVRLGVRVTPSSTTTDSNGQAKFRLDSFHLGGNENLSAADEIMATSAAGTTRGIVRSAVPGMDALVDDRNGGLTTSGLVGRHLQPQIIQVLKSIGQAWQRVGGKPSGMPNFITVTGASLRWGGLNPPHLTHRFGGTADIRPIGTRDAPISVGDGYYHREGTKILVDFMQRTGATEIRFADNLPGVTAVDSSHADHIHVSWLNHPAEPWFLPREQEMEQAIAELARTSFTLG